jgi:hypothetical protein
MSRHNIKSVSLLPLIALMMEAVSASETSVNFYETTRRNIQDLQTKTNFNIVWEDLCLITLFLVWCTCFQETVTFLIKVLQHYAVASERLCWLSETRWQARGK